jgi:DNA-binding CsgD family transcriptional regulator
MSRPKETWYQDSVDLIAVNRVGRPRLKSPSLKVLELLNLVKMGISLADIGREYNCSRQYVYQLKLRWGDYL